MVRNLVVRDLKVRHRGTALGMLWSLVTPMAMLATYTVVFTVVFKASLEGKQYPFVLYLFAGLVVWNLFASSLTTTTASVVSGSPFLRKLYFPRIILPIVATVSSLITFCFEFAVFVAFVLGYQIWPTITYLALIPVLLGVLLMAFGLGCILSVATVYLRDIPHFLGIILQLGFFGTPIVYLTTQFPEDGTFYQLIRLNPMYYVVTAFRDATLDHQWPQLSYLLIPIGIGLVLSAIGFNVYQRAQRRFAELV
jgi:ABC-type polysaccharide/polyol phosphate export permease